MSAYYRLDDVLSNARYLARQTGIRRKVRVYRGVLLIDEAER